MSSEDREDGLMTGICLRCGEENQVPKADEIFLCAACGTKNGEPLPDDGCPICNPQGGKQSTARMNQRRRKHGSKEQK